MNYNTMPSYNPYPYAANSYMQTYPQQNQPQYSQQPSANYAATQQSMTGILWVDGEVGAKAFQLPTGWPANTPLPLWDTNDTIIYLKSTNQMGMPNPLQKVHYTMDEVPKAPMQASGTMALPSGDQGHDPSNYATKDDLERMKEEIRATVTEAMAQSTPAKRGTKNESAV